MFDVKMIVRRIVAERLKIDVIVRSEAFANIASPLAALRNADVIPAQIKPLPFGMQTTARMLTVAGRRYDALRQPERVSRGSSGGQRRRHAPIGRTSCRERGGQVVVVLGGALTLKKKTKKNT